MDKKTIWIITQDASYHEARSLSLSKVFAENGYNAAVITTSFSHGSKKYIYDEPIKFVERMPGVMYVYIKTSPSYNTNGAARILNMLDLCRKYKNYEALIAEKTGAPNFITASEDNPFMPEIIYKAAKKFNAKFITEIRDIWPVSLMEFMGLSKYHPFVMLMKFLEKRAYRRSDAIITSMPFAYKYIEEVSGVKRDKVFWIANGIDTEETDKNLKSGEKLPADLDEYLTDNWCAVYTGSIVKAEAVDALVNAWEYLQDTDIYLAIIGDGTEKQSIQNLIDSKNLKHVKYFPAIKASLVIKALNKGKCCVSIANLKKTQHSTGNYGLSKIKLNDYLYSGRPVIFECNYENVVNDAGHFAIPSNGSKAFAETVRKVRNLGKAELKELAEKGRSIIMRDYDYHVIGRKYINILENLDRK